MSTEQPNEEQNQTTPTIDTRPDSLLMKKKNAVETSVVVVVVVA